MYTLETSLLSVSSAIEDVDLLQALKKIYVATLYVQNTKMSEEYNGLKKNLEFMKKFLRECFTK